MYKIVCKLLTPERKKIIASLDVVAIGKPLRMVLAVGGAYIFYYGTNPNTPETVQGAAVLFSVVGIAMVLFAIFSQILKEMKYFAGAKKEGCFPDEVKAGKGGISIIYKKTDRKIKEQAEKEQYYFYPQVENIEEHEKFLKLCLSGDENRKSGLSHFVYIFKEDFEKGNPEAFISFINTKKS